jgi:DNA polymerase I-like protein with 3'-5' exonuclease and polymerase domains
VFKTGAKVGQPRYKIVTHEYEFPRQFEPIKGSELKKDGYYATDEQTLKRLRGTKETKRFLGLLDKRAKLEKLRGTYYEGFPKKIAEMGWRDDIIHASYNSCVAVTGRLSSTQPNCQNIPPEGKRLCISRYAE